MKQEPILTTPEGILFEINKMPVKFKDANDETSILNFIDHIHKVKDALLKLYVKEKINSDDFNKNLSELVRLEEDVINQKAKKFGEAFIDVCRKKQKEYINKKLQLIKKERAERAGVLFAMLPPEKQLVRTRLLEKSIEELYIHVNNVNALQSYRTVLDGFISAIAKETKNFDEMMKTDKTQEATNEWNLLNSSIEPFFAEYNLKKFEKTYNHRKTKPWVKTFFVKSVQGCIDEQYQHVHTSVKKFCDVLKEIHVEQYMSGSIKPVSLEALIKAVAELQKTLAQAEKELGKYPKHPNATEKKAFYTKMLDELTWAFTTGRPKADDKKPGL